MIYNFIEDFCNMKTTIYTYGEIKSENGEIIQLPLSRPLKKDLPFSKIFSKTGLDWLFKDSKWGKSLSEITFKARTYSHGSNEYNDIKMHMPGYTWVGTVKTYDELDEENQEFYQKRCKRSIQNMELNGLVCVEFDDIEINEVEDLVQKALRKFPHLIYVGRTLSNKMFCMHRADENINTNNYINYFKELAVNYYNELGIKADTACSDCARMRYICDQKGSRAQMEYCDFKPSENISIEYDKIFGEKNKSYIQRVGNIKNKEFKSDETIYEYDENKGFYYGHTKQHLHHIGELIVPVPSIEQIINTLIALGKTCDEIIELWKTTLKYYNYNTNSKNVNDNIRLTEKISKDKREFIIGKDTYNFLAMFFPEIVGLKSFFLDRNEFLCDRFYETLRDGINIFHRILIWGDTGIGKTHFANKLSLDKNVIVVVPYIAHMDNYPQYNQIEIRKEMNMIKEGVIIWDRFVKLYNENLIDDKSIIIIDESHKIFLDQTYRKAAIQMSNILKVISNDICYISATPIKEIEVNKTYRFEKDRNIVKTQYFKIIPEDIEKIDGSLTLEAIFHLIYGNLNYYDRIFIASDQFAQKIYDRLYGRYDCMLIRASQKDSKEFIELMQEQTLKHKIIIGTCISYESLNFNNKGENILTISTIDEKTTAHKITQIAGRIRFSKNKLILIESVKKVNIDIDYNEQAEFYNKINEIKSKYNLYTRNHYIQNYADEVKEVNEWYLENNNIDTIKENLPMYIKWEETEINAKSIYSKSPLNEQVKNYIEDYLKSNDEMFNNVDIVIGNEDLTNQFFDIKYIKINEEGQAAYIIRENIREQQYAYSKLLSNVNYNKINKLIVEAHTLPKGVNREILRIIDIINMDENNYNKFVDDLESYLMTLHDVYYFSLDRTIKEIKSIRSKYIKCKKENDVDMYRNVFDRYYDYKLKIYDNKINAARNGGKKTIKIKDLETGIIYDSCGDCAKAIKHNVTYISKHPNRFVKM